MDRWCSFPRRGLLGGVCDAHSHVHQLHASDRSDAWDWLVLTPHAAISILVVLDELLHAGLVLPVVRILHDLLLLNPKPGANSNLLQ